VSWITTAEVMSGALIDTIDHATRFRSYAGVESAI
jgi:hypothetical protein